MTASRKTAKLIHASAEISADGLYRYRLSRYYCINDGSPHEAKTMLFVMLNPSTADGEKDDATVRRISDFALRMGYERITVVNLFAFRARHPGALRRSSDPVGPENDRHIRHAAAAANLVVVAWGAHRSIAMRQRASEVTDILRACHFTPVLYCLGLNRDGSPKHPVYMRGDAELERYDA